MEDQENHLDIVSDPRSGDSASQDIPVPNQAADPKKSHHSKEPRKTVRVLFGCCQVYARIPVPLRVLQGDLCTWRVHCVRCGKMVEVPV